MEAGQHTTEIEPTHLDVREFARRKVWAMTDPGTAGRWDEDIASDVLIEWMDASARPDLEIRNWRGWVGSAVRSRLYAERRRERLRRKVHERYAQGALRSHAEPEPVEVAEGNEAVTQLDDAMRSLRSRKQKQVLALSYLKGMTSSEIGDVLGMSPESVRGCKKRAIEKLRGVHHDRGFDESLMGVEIGIAATLSLLQPHGPKEWLASMTSQASDSVQGAAASIKQIVARITGAGTGPAGDQATGTVAGAGGVAGTAAAVGGGKLIGAVCAGVGSVCVAGALVAGVGPGIGPASNDQDRSTRPVTETRPVAEPVSTSTSMIAPVAESSDVGNSNSRSRDRRRKATSSSSQTVEPVTTSTSGPASVATPAEAADAFSPPIGGGDSAPASSSSSGSGSQTAGKSGSGNTASAGQAAQAFGPLP